MTSDRSEAKKSSWWTTLPGILTGIATFVASIATILALFIQPGGGNDAPSTTNERPATSRTLSGTAVAVSEVTLDGRSPDPIRRRESNLGDLIADAILHAATADAEQTRGPVPDVAIINGGAIRLNGALPPGDVTETDALNIVPFRDVIVTLPSVSRDEFKAVLEHAYARLPATSEAGRFAHVAGFTVALDTTQDAALASAGDRAKAGKRVRRVTLSDGTPIVAGGGVRPGPALNVATGAFLATGGDQYPFPRTDYTPTRVGYAEALARYLQGPAAEGALAGRVTADDYPEGGEGRITITPPLPALP
jgi:2',3'-cyclic-nucleotide 2'-phosphodiesterase (5'-nucleotidase family)